MGCADHKEEALTEPWRADIPEGAAKPSVWWRPENTTRVLTGDLTVDSSGRIELGLVGSFNLAAPLQLDSIPLVYGYDAENRPITLTGLIGIGTHLGFPGFTRSRFLASRMFTGAHIHLAEKFDELWIGSTYLPDWVRNRSFTSDFTRRFGERTPSIGIAYRRPTRYHAGTGDLARIELTSTHSVKHGRASIALEEAIYLRVRTKHQLSPDDLITKYGKPLLDLVTLGTQRANAFTKVVLRSRRHATHLAPRKIVRKEIEYVAPWIAEGVQAASEDRLLPHDQLFTLVDAGVVFSEIVPRWLAIRQELAECLTPFFSLLYAPPTFQDTRLITLAPALEAYHRLRYRQTLIDGTEFRAIRKAMVEAIPPERRGTLAGGLQYINQVTQRSRLTDLVLQTSPLLPGLFDAQPNFVNELVDQRNRQTHPAGGMRTRPLGGPAIYRVSRTAEYIVQACLMRELNLETTASDWFKRNRSYVSFVAQLAQLV